MAIRWLINVFLFVINYISWNQALSPATIINVQPAGQDSENDNIGMALVSSSAEYFNGNFTALTGEWTVTVKELVLAPEPGSDYPGTHPASDTKRLAGPWVFHLQVP